MNDDDICVVLDEQHEGLGLVVKRWRGQTGMEAERAFAAYCQKQIPPGAGMKALFQIMQEEATEVSYSSVLFSDSATAQKTTAAETDPAPLPKPKPARIELPPGATAARILRSLLSPKFFRVHAQVVISEMQAEYIDHIAEGREWSARFTIVRGHLMLLAPLFRALAPGAVRKLL